MPLLFLASLVFGAAMLLPAALAARETSFPPMDRFLRSALAAQWVGHGRWFLPSAISRRWWSALASSPSPALSALLGWLYYGESFTPLDWLGAGNDLVALILVRLRSSKDVRLRAADTSPKQT